MYHSTRVEVGGQLSGIAIQVLGIKLKSSDWVASALSLSRPVGSVVLKWGDSHSIARLTLNSRNPPPKS